MVRLFLLCSSLVIAGSMTIGRDVTIEDVVLLARAGFVDGVILQALDLQLVDAACPADALVKLRNAGVHDRVLEFLQGERRRVQHIKLLDPGVYRKRGEEYVLVESERAAWRSTATAVSVASTALTRIRITGLIEGAQSCLRLKEHCELLIVPSSGHATSEYQLFRAETKDGWREVSGEVALRAGKLLGLSGGDGVSLTTLLDHSFDLGARAPLRTLRKGEYVLVSPGLIVAGQMLGTSHVYTFGVD